MKYTTIQRQYYDHFGGMSKVYYELFPLLQLNGSGPINGHSDFIAYLGTLRRTIGNEVWSDRMDHEHA